MIIGLVSCYREGLPMLATVRSAAAGCDLVGVFEGVVGKEVPDSEPGDESPLDECRAMPNVRVASLQHYHSDADKRTYMLDWAKTAHAQHRKRDETLWVLVLDGDEVLVWGEYLRDWVYRAEYTTAAGGFPLRIVELDGSVGLTHGRILKANVVRRYLHSGYQLELITGMVVALPNVKICTAGGLPVKPEGGWVMPPEEMDAYNATHRPPVHGEPHVLHRSMLRHPERASAIRRLSDVENDWFKEMEQAHGLEDAVAQATRGVARPT